MAEVTPSKQNIQQEEVNFKSAVSEQLSSKISASINFINNKQFCTFKFDFLGPFEPLGLGGGEDGRLVFPFDAEICCLATSLRETGSSGATVIDLHKINTSGADQGSIFQSFHTYSIPGGFGGNEKGFFRNYIDGTSVFPTGSTGGTRGDMPDANRLFSAGEVLRVDVSSAADGARDLSVTVFYRPR